MSVNTKGWTRLGLENGGNAAALARLQNGNDMIAWFAPASTNKQFYDAVQLGPRGGIAVGPRDIFGGRDWTNLTGFPTLVSDRGQALLIFEGGDGRPRDPYFDGCIVGDLFTSRGWKLQPWSLSANCVNPDHFGATVTRNGTLAAAFPGGWNKGNGIRYHIGASPSIPATPDDRHLATMPGLAGSVGAATEWRTQQIYAAWDRSFSEPPGKPPTPNDAVWAADLTSKSPKALKMPGTGGNTVARQPENVAIASPIGRGGTYVAACNNGSPCSQVKLWRYGSKSSRTVPGSSYPTSVAISAGPAGRLWIAWWSGQNGTVRVVRTNKAGNRFGPVETHSGPRGCQSDGNGTVKISGGSQQRLDVVVGCWGLISTNKYREEVMATQSLVPLQLAENAVGSIKRKNGESVTIRISDVGDAVEGATVHLYGKNAPQPRVTDKKGQVTFHFPKGSAATGFEVVASMRGYLNASTSFRTG
jgi:hypothetical protein